MPFEFISAPEDPSAWSARDKERRNIAAQIAVRQLRESLRALNAETNREYAPLDTLIENDLREIENGVAGPPERISEVLHRLAAVIHEAIEDSRARKSLHKDSAVAAQPEQTSSDEAWMKVQQAMDRISELFGESSTPREHGA